MSAVSERNVANVNRWVNTNKYKYEHNWKFYTSNCVRLVYNKQCAQVFTKCCEFCAGKGRQHAHKCKYRQQNARFWRPPAVETMPSSSPRPSGQARTPAPEQCHPLPWRLPGSAREQDLSLWPGVVGEAKDKFRIQNIIIDQSNHQTTSARVCEVEFLFTCDVKRAGDQGEGY